MQHTPPYIGCLFAIYTVLLLSSCKNSKIAGEVGKEVAGKLAEGAASAAVTSFFTQSKSEAKQPEQDLSSLKADQSLAAEERVAEIKEAINLANEIEAQAYRNLSPNSLANIYTGKALQLRQTLVNTLAAEKVYQVETLHNQQFHDFKVSSDSSIAKVEMTERWSSRLYSSDTNTLVGQFLLHDVPQVVYLQKDSNGWRISAIVFQDDSPEFIPAQSQQEIDPSPSSSVTLSPSDSRENLKPSSSKFGILTARDSKAQINVRDGPGTNYHNRHYGIAGDKVDIIASTHSNDGLVWYQVKFQVSGAEGWVRSDFIQIEN